MQVLGVAQTPSDFEVPKGACDCHIHLFGPRDRYPLAEDRLYTPPVVGLDELTALQSALSTERAVVVQASAQGTDNSHLVDALTRWPSRLRGVAVVADDPPDSELMALRTAGVRGIRLNFQSHGITDPTVARARLVAMAARLAAHSLHAQLYVGADLLVALSETIADLPCPVVLDHFGRLDPANGLDHPQARCVTGLVRGGNVYVKLSAAHRIAGSPAFRDMQATATALFEANPERIVWGSDWPHVLAFRPRSATGPDPLHPVDDGATLSHLASWFDGPALRRILVDNPARLYDF